MQPDDSLSLGEAIRRALRDARYTQAQLAHELGTDPSQVSRWVNDKAVPLVGTIRAMERMLGTDLSAAFDRSTVDYELYVSAPISGLTNDNAVQEHNDCVRHVVAAASQHVNSLYWPGSDIRQLSDLAAADLVTERNWSVLAQCMAFLYLQFDEIVRPTGALVELGFALGRRMKTTIVVNKNVTHPHMLAGFGRVAEKLPFLPEARTYRVDSVDEACDLVKKNGREILGLT